jgi:hypothetical protein
VKRLLTGEGHTSVSRFDTSTTDHIFDTRVKTADNISVALLNYVLLEGVAGTTYSTAYVSVCPGNEAGDGTCAKVKAPAYDRGIGTVSPMDGQTGDLQASITYAGSSFHVLGDNATNSSSTINAKAFGYRFTPSKTTYGSAVTSDNTSTAAHSELSTPLTDNDTRVSNVLTRGTNVWFAMAADNSTTGPALGGGEGDNVSLMVRANGTAAFTDNGTKITNNAGLTTFPQISDAGDGVYIMTGAGTTVTSFNAYDNSTVKYLGATTVGTANTWCSASTGTAQEYAVIVSDNGSSSGAAGVYVSKVYDNGSSVVMTTAATGAHTDLELCALTHLGGTFYLALSDNLGTSDNVSVWKSTDMTSWTQIGSDLTMTENIVGLDIATTGSSASDYAVWVAVNDASSVELVHYEDVSGGSTYAWRSVGALLTSASETVGGNGRVSVATDGTSVIAVSAIVGANTRVGFWYNQ